MRKTGLIMHDVEDVILETLTAQEMPTALFVTHSILKKRHKKNREVYVSTGKSPVFVLKAIISKKKVAKLTKRLTPIIRELTVDHDLQWGEVLNLIHGYLRVHSVGSNYVFSYESKCG